MNELFFLFLHENKKKCTPSGNFRFDINPAHFKILSTQELKHGNVCKIILKTLFQKYRLELTQCIQIYVDHGLRRYCLRYLVIGQKQNFLGANWNGPADSIRNVYTSHR